MNRNWQHSLANESFLVSTSPDLLSYEFIQTAFDNAAMYWAQPIADTDMKIMLANSLTFGLYKEGGTDSRGEVKNTPIGLARIITDYVTFAYLTDVYILSTYRGLGLGKWLIACCKETIEDIPSLRRVVLLTSSDYGIRFYKREMGLEVMSADKDGLVAMSGKKANLKLAGSGKESNPSA